MSSAASMLQEAEQLKSSITDNPSRSTDVWIARQKLQEVYQTLLLSDLEYALDKKVEQDLWNHAFKNQINTLQTQSRDRQNPSRSEVQTSLTLFLESASGFYIQFLQEICSTFNLNVSCRRHSSRLGVLCENKLLPKGSRPPKRASCLYICQHCLVHLGDIARYRQQIDQAENYYTHAAQLIPYNGQPYNQLAILEAARGNKLCTIFFYIRSIAVKHPFPVASTNLEKFYIKISKDNYDLKGKHSLNELLLCFLQFHAFIHLTTELDRARRLEERWTLCLPAHITSNSLSTLRLIQVLAINLFALHSLSHQGEPSSTATLSVDEHKAYNLVLNSTVSFFDHLLRLTPKQVNAKVREAHLLPVLKVILDWLTSDPNLLSKPVFTSVLIWPNLCKLLNTLQQSSGVQNFNPEAYATTPLQEDWDLQYFTPLTNTHSGLDFTGGMPHLDADLESHLRCHRLVERSLWICNNYPTIMCFQVMNTGRIQFAVDTGKMKGMEKIVVEKSPVRKSRQNVAIQAIMQSKISSPSGVRYQTSSEDKQLPHQLDVNMRPEAGLYAVTSSDLMPPSSPCAVHLLRREDDVFQNVLTDPSLSLGELVQGARWQHLSPRDPVVSPPHSSPADNAFQWSDLSAGSFWTPATSSSSKLSGGSTSLFSSPEDGATEGEIEESGTYQLFSGSHSPWSLPLPMDSKENLPFAGSNRSTPESYISRARHQSAGEGCSVGAGEGAWPAADTKADEGMWSSGTSAIEELLMKQRQRRTDPPH